MLDRSEDGPPRKSLISDKQAAAIKKNSRRNPNAGDSPSYKKAQAAVDSDNKRLIANPAILRRVAAQRKARDAAKKGR